MTSVARKRIFAVPHLRANRRQIALALLCAGLPGLVCSPAYGGCTLESIREGRVGQIHDHGVERPLEAVAAHFRHSLRGHRAGPVHHAASSVRDYREWRTMQFGNVKVEKIR